jgi:membrane protease YdiL (CAAX protease family)
MLEPKPIIDARKLIRSVFLYYGIAIGWAWLIWAPLVLGADGLKLISINPSLPVLTCIATLGPSLGCVITHRIETGNWKAIRLLPPTRWRWSWVILGPLIILLCIFLIYPAFISSGSPAQWRWHPSVLAGLWVPMFNYNILGGPLFEEPGWRGFLQPRLEEAMPPWIAAICVGSMWAAWHTPLFFVTWTSASPFSVSSHRRTPGTAHEKAEDSYTTIASKLGPSDMSGMNLNREMADRETRSKFRLVLTGQSIHPVVCWRFIARPEPAGSEALPRQTHRFQHRENRPC